MFIVARFDVFLINSSSNDFDIFFSSKILYMETQSTLQRSAQ